MATTKTKITKTTVDRLRAEAMGSGEILAYDTDVRGFGVRISKTGNAAYFMEYKLGGRAGKSRRMSIGRHGELTPDQARRAAETLRGQINQGIDPAAEKAAERDRLTAETFRDAVTLYLDTQGGDNRSWPETRRLIMHDAIPVLGDRPMAAIELREVVAMIDRVQRRSHSVARALFAALRPFWKWARKHGLSANLLADVDAPKPCKSRDRALTDEELRAAWETTFDLGWPFGPCIRLMILTAQREDEVGGMEWSELKGDVWELPGGDSWRTKNDQIHLVYLSPQAQAILDELPEIACKGGRSFVFTTTRRTPISGWSKAKVAMDAGMLERLGGELWERYQGAGGNDAAAVRLGYEDGERLRRSILPAWRFHDLRRTAATGMQADGFPIEVTERVINHISGQTTGGLAIVYNRFKYFEERKAALLAWGNRVERIVS